MNARLLKVEGSGNDFILGIGHWAELLAEQSAPVVDLCDRHRGLGADGTLALLEGVGDIVQLVYRNADGDVADFCANATRCAARAAVEMLGYPPQLVIDTGWGPIHAKVAGAEVALEIPPPAAPPRYPEIEAVSPLEDFQFLEVGVPHLVAAAKNLKDIDLAVVAPPLRRNSVFGPDGTNVNLYEVGDKNVVAVRSWERGVEGETLSCGSGMVAVALVVMDRNGLRRVVCVPRSGDELVVEALGEPPMCTVRFTGPTRFIAEIEPTEEFLSS